MAELADALVLGASGQPCEFESHWPHSLSEKGQFFRFPHLTFSDS